MLLSNEKRTPWLLNREVLLLAFLGFVTFWVFVFTKSMANREAELESRIAGVWYQKGMADIASGKMDAAIQSLRTANADAQGNRQYTLTLATALTKRGDMAEAEQVLLRLREGDPEDAEVNTNLARLAARRGALDDAVHYYQNALYGRWSGSGVDERRRQLRVELIRYLLSQQKHNLAISELLILETESQVSATARIETAKLFEDAGDLQDALNNYTEAVRVDSQNVEALAGVGTTAYRLGDFSKASHFLKRALEANPSLTKVKEMLTVADLVQDADPLAPHLSVEDRQKRLLADLKQTQERIDECLGKQVDSSRTERMQSLKTQAATTEPELSRRGHPPNLDAVMSGMNLIFKMQKEASSVCGVPSPRDEALLLLESRHGGARP